MTPPIAAVSSRPWADGKPGLPSDIIGKLWSARLSKLYVRQARDGGACTFFLRRAFDAEASDQYGAATAWTTVEVQPTGTLAVEIGMFNKSATRLPEAMFVQFQTRDTNVSWSVSKLGQWVQSDEIVAGGSKHLHGVMESGLRARTAEGHMLQIATQDAAVANFGELTAYPSPVNKTADTATFGSSFVLWDNLWGTNCTCDGRPRTRDRRGRLFSAR